MSISSGVSRQYITLTDPLNGIIKDKLSATS